MDFTITYTDPGSQARTGYFQTAHGRVETPVFMPVGTGATVKGVHQRELRDDLNASIILGNTYHLFLRPGMEVMREVGGLHRFMGWDRPILTDSGGYQVYSLSSNRKLTGEGAHFSSHIDGSRHLFTPENVVDIQRVIGSDLMMAFDECTPYPCDRGDAAHSMQLTHDWLARGVARFKASEPLYGYEQTFLPIVQGSIYPELRKQSAEIITGADMPANAIGGLSVGEPEELMYEMIAVTNAVLPKDRPRYLMGVGTPANLLEAISLGVDMFDCVMPTRNGRNGMLFTHQGVIHIKNQKWKNDFTPLDRDSDLFVDQAYSKAYLRHLFVSGERLAAQVASIHNLGFYLQLMDACRNRIREGRFSTWKAEILPRIKTRL